MADLGELYQSLILDHNRAPRNHREMADADRSAAGRNPMCGDQLTVWIRLDGDRIADVSFLGKGCAISQASASLMTTMIKGKTRAEAEALVERFRAMVTGSSDETASMGRLAAFAGVARFPARVKCASLAWHALRSALAEGGNEVSTE